MRRLEPGSTIVLREIWDGRVWTARPLVVVQDDPSQRAFCAFPGTRWKAPARRDGSLLHLPEDDWRLIDRLWAGSTILSFAWPDTSAAVLLFFEQGTGALQRLYVNLQDPLRPVSSGFDTTDHILDAVIEPDRSGWRWKDEDELAEAVARGLFTPSQADAFRRDGELTVRRIMDGDPPFDRDWAGWEPEPTWPIPRLPGGWDAVET